MKDTKNQLQKMDGREAVVSKCPGRVRIPHLMGWYVKNEETAFQATYCAVCLAYGCAGCSRSGVSLQVCRLTFCDCPNPAVHAESNLDLIPIECERCSDRMFGVGSLGSCRNCRNPDANGHRLCIYCSNVLGRCQSCMRQKFEFPFLVKLLDLPMVVYLALVWAMSYQPPPPVFPAGY